MLTLLAVSDLAYAQTSEVGFEADVVTVNQDTGELNAEGNVVLTQPEVN